MTNLNSIKIPGVKNCIAVPAAEIIRVEALSNYSRIYFANGEKLVVAKVLHWFEDRLPTGVFARVHRSHLINKFFVKNINKSHSNTVLLYNGESIAISRRKRSAMS